MSSRLLLQLINTPRWLGFALGWNGGMANVMVQVVQTDKICLVMLRKNEICYQTNEEVFWES